jgi:hypothetical protein
MRKATWGQIWPQRGKIEILEKRLSPTAQNHYADLEDTCRDKVTKFGIIVRYAKKVVEKIRRLGSNYPWVAFWGLNAWNTHKAHMKFMQNIKCALVGPLPYQISTKPVKQFGHISYE